VRTDPDQEVGSQLKNDYEKHPLYPHEEEVEALLFIRSMQEINKELVAGVSWSLSVGEHQRSAEEDRFLREQINKFFAQRLIMYGHYLVHNCSNGGPQDVLIEINQDFESQGEN
jgi:hypothetical protein